MTNEARCAHVIAQAAMLNAEIAGMQSENQWCLARGEALAYTEKDFAERAAAYALDHNSVIQYLG